jgi:hypothetical protein
MRRLALLIGLFALLFASTPRSQSSAKTPEPLAAAFDAHKGDFDYLLGDWQFDAKSQEHGVYHGLWSAVRLTEGQILDEFRVVGDNQQTIYLTTTIRAYNAAADRWDLIGMDQGNGLQDVGTGRRSGGEVHIEQTFGATGPRPLLRKIRYFNIQADRFSWTSDRSNDGGKTWIKDELQIEARRTGPARTLEPLTRVKSPSKE